LANIILAKLSLALRFPVSSLSLTPSHPCSMELRKHPGLTDKKLMKMSGIKKGTFYRYKKVLQGKGLI